MRESVGQLWSVLSGRRRGERTGGRQRLGTAGYARRTGHPALQPATWGKGGRLKRLSLSDYCAGVGRGIVVESGWLFDIEDCFALGRARSARPNGPPAALVCRENFIAASHAASAAFGSAAPSGSALKLGVKDRGCGSPGGSPSSQDGLTACWAGPLTSMLSRAGARRREGRIRAWLARYLQP